MSQERKRRFAFLAPIVKAPDSEREPPLPSARKFATLKPVGDVRHDLVRDYYTQFPDAGFAPDAFWCREAESCDGVKMDGVVFHAWFCSWWHHADNVKKTPF